MTKKIRKRNKLGQFAKASPWTDVTFFKIVRQMSLKLLALTLIVGLNAVALSQIGYTMGYYNDIESSTDNTFEAGEVDFSLEVSNWQPPETGVSMASGDITKKTVDVDPLDSNPFQYYAELTNMVGDSGFCDGLNVVATLDGEEVYDGPLADLLTVPTETLDSWEFTYTTSTDFQNSVCDFDIDYNGWQTRHDYPTYEDGGYSDTEKISNHLASPGFRINKVYYNVAADRGAEGVNEWVEIYNQTDIPLDISGWQICDNTSCDTIPLLTPLIPAQKYAVIVADPGTVSSLLPTYWYLPSEVTMINLGGEIGNGLHNDNDMLILKRPDGVVIDQMNWGTPDTGWTNYNTNVWDPGVADVAEGNVLARVPSGYDTDQASDWEELVPPSVNLIYPDEGGSYTWYWTYSYTITWTATNNNGDDDDLDISIFYVKDENHDNIISASDTTNVIAETTDNDGSFNWTVPSGFLGYIWVYLVATGPENPMLNTGTISGSIYDPFPIYLGPENVEAPQPEAGQPSAEEVVTEGSPEETSIPEEIIEISETVEVNDETITPTEEQEEVVEVEQTEVIEESTEEVVDTEIVDETVTEEPVAEEMTVPEEVTVEAEPVIEPEPAPEPESGATVGEAEPATSE